MPSLGVVVRGYLRAAGIWAGAAGILLAVRFVGDIALIPAALRCGEAAVMALVLGVMGNAWLAALLRSYSTMLSSRTIPVSLSRALLYLWQIIVVGAVASQYAGIVALLKWARPPYVITAFSLVLALAAVRAISGQMTKPTPLHWTHLAAAVSLAISTLLIDVFGYATAIVKLAIPVFTVGWVSAVGVTLFAEGMALESYEESKPIWVALGGCGAMTLGSLFGSQISGLIYFAGLMMYVFSLATLLRERWDGRFDTWSNRLLLAGLIAMFAGLATPQGATFVGVLIFWPGTASSVDMPAPILVPSILLIAYAWSAAALLEINGRLVSERMGRLILWPGVIGIAVPWTLMAIGHFNPIDRYGSIWIRAIFGAGTLLLVWGCLALGAQVRTSSRRSRGRLKVVE